MGIFEEDDYPIASEFLEPVDKLEESEYDTDPTLNAIYKEREAFYEEYLKVGQFCFMTPQQFEDMGDVDKLILSRKIDERLKPYIEELSKRSSSSGKGPSDGKKMLPINYMHLAIILSLATMLGNDDKT